MAEQALHLLLGEQAHDAPLPDLILLDWHLPTVSGEEVLRRLKEHSMLRRIPVLVFSSSEADEDIHAAYNNFANGYIAKHCCPAKLFRQRISLLESAGWGELSIFRFELFSFPHVQFSTFRRGRCARDNG